MPTGTPPTAAQPAAPKPKLRWYQYSLRSLMLFVLVCAIACSWFATRLERASRQKAAVEAIRKTGLLCVLYDDMVDGNGYIDIAGLDDPFPDPDWWERLVGWDFFHSATGVIPADDVSGRTELGPIPVEALHRLKDMPYLRELCLFGIDVSDADLECLLPLVQLRCLNLTSTKVTDAAVERLQKALPNCTIDRSTPGFRGFQRGLRPREAPARSAPSRQERK